MLDRDDLAVSNWSSSNRQLLREYVEKIDKIRILHTCLEYITEGEDEPPRQSLRRLLHLLTQLVSLYQ